MTLEFIDHRPEAVESWWTPFTSSDGYEHPHWWQSAGGTIGDPWIVQVLEAGVEVARVQLDEIGGINPHYSNVPAIGDEQLEIQFIEVATAARRRKIGTQVVQALSVRSPDRRLLAYSKVRTNSGHRSVGTGSITRTGVTAPCSSSRSGICPKYALLATNARHEGALQVTGFIRGPQLADLLTQSARAAFNELERLDADHLLSENVDVLVHGLLARHMPEPVSVDWTAARGTPVQETTIERTTMEFGERRDYRIPGSRLTVSWPLTGTAEILRRQASQFTWGADHGTIMDHSVQLNIEGTELSTEFIEQQMAAVHEDVEKRIGWANHDVTVHRTAVERELRQAIEARRARISENRRISTALNIPIMPTGAQRPPVPARRRQVPLQQRRASVEFTPEPVLEEAIYRDILGVVENWARAFQ